MKPCWLLREARMGRRLRRADGSGQYITLCTCAYAFTDARYVLHGRPVPVDNAAGAGDGAREEGEPLERGQETMGVIGR